MILLEKSEVWGFEHAIRGMRNPLNSWARSDSHWIDDESEERSYEVGENDAELMTKLIRGGAPHRKFLRQIFVSVDITAPLYWWKEFDTYKVGTVANSTSTMHKIHAKPIEMGDFSFDHLTPASKEAAEKFVDYIESVRLKYLENKEKEYWYDLIQLLPSSYNQMRTVTMNYENLSNMYYARRAHKLDEWHTFCDFIKELPYADVMIMTKEEEQ